MIRARSTIFAATFLGMASTTPAPAQQYRDGYPEVMPPEPIVDDSGIRYQPGDYSTLMQHYADSGQPSVLVLLGRTLGAETSEWSADTRDVSSSVQQSFQGPSSATTRQQNIRQSETRQPVMAQASQAMQAFERGLDQLFAQVGVNRLHYDAAVRRAQQENELGGRVTREGDLRKNEADAVLKYAELILEVTSAGTTPIEGVDVESFRVRLSRVDTNQILAQYTTSPQEAATVERSWRAGSAGYEQVAEVRLDYDDLGFDVALNVLNQAFSSPLHIIPGNQRKQPVRPATEGVRGGRKPRLDNGGG